MSHLLAKVPLVREGLYVGLMVTSALTFILAAAFCGLWNGWVNNMGFGRASFNIGVPGGVPVLLVAGLFTLFGLGPLHFIFHRKDSPVIYASVAVELGITLILWILFVAGAGSFSGWGYLTCNGESLCGVGQAVLAFGWLSWIILTVLIPLLLITALIESKKRNDVWLSAWKVDPSAAPKSNVEMTAPEPAKI